MDKKTIAPTFIVGARRSGTMFLYKMSCLHRDICFISQYDSRVPVWVPTPLLTTLAAPFHRLKIGAWFEKGESAYNVRRSRSVLKRIMPSPAEGERVYAECGAPGMNGHGDFRGDEQLRKRIRVMCHLSGKNVFVTRISGNNGKIDWLLRQIPEARFIHLIRDGRDVAFSLSQIDLWSRHSRDKRANAIALHAETWAREVSAVRKALESVPAHHKLEIRYEDLASNIPATASDVFGFLNLEIYPRLDKVLGELRLARRHTSWREQLKPYEVQQILIHEGRLLQQLGYLR